MRMLAPLLLQHLLLLPPFEAVELEPRVLAHIVALAAVLLLTAASAAMPLIVARDFPDR